MGVEMLLYGSNMVRVFAASDWFKNWAILMLHVFLSSPVIWVLRRRSCVLRTNPLIYTMLWSCTYDYQLTLWPNRADRAVESRTSFSQTLSQSVDSALKGLSILLARRVP